ncbi:alpha/beta hydrolase fold-3 domain protein [Lepidopterella palustris CBS 459.81]|uniref:Alpha/beta hydrolase fold-3 domain protein n=1 Tax=Lepidopterella palustris CBS 459.81 TaxID=1314670 RepID=A0A8E2JA31_9PEZI|nr:alpha/beta hydrolase fold-3 domain protein [Lepidopterella palustris CBS 459.81]
MASLPKPPYDPELAAALEKIPVIKTMTKEMIPMARPSLSKANTAEQVISGRDISHEERILPGPGGNITVSIFRSAKTASTANDDKPGIYFIHGGGMVMGNRFFGMALVVDWIEQCDAVCVSVEYRQAPENPHPALIEDCYAGLKWLGDNLADLNIDPTRLMLAGQSAGGGIAAGLALLARDRGGPTLCAQLLMCPMLDDRYESTSSKQYAEEGSWSGNTNQMAWECLLGDRVGGDDVSPYAAAARAADLSRLPSTFIDVGAAEVYRDEDVAYASRLWAAGVQAELHVWPGAFHAFDMLAPSAVLSQIASRTRTAWVRRTLLKK